MSSSLHNDSEGISFETQERTLAPGNEDDGDHQSMPNDTETNPEENSNITSSSTPPLNTDVESPKENDSPVSVPKASSDSSTNTEEEEKEKEEDDDQEEKPHEPKSATAGCEVSSVVISSLDQLPPLPKPRDDMLRQETPRGICVVTTCITLCIFLTHYFALTLVLPSEDFDVDGDDDLDGNPYNVGKIVFLVLVYTESVVALLCMAGILYADPGVVHRSLESCNPLPKAVESWVVSEPTAPRPKGLDSYLRGADNRLYCTKCLVWRKPGVPNYHCPVCQRCCANHDHHCNVFGRCIAGNAKFWKCNNNRGNLMYFHGILASGGLGFLTVFAAFLYAFSIRYRPEYAIPICIGITLVISCCCLCSGPITAVCWPCRRVCRKVTAFRPRQQSHHQVFD